jgi:hypothetical protein
MPYEHVARGDTRDADPVLAVGHELLLDEVVSDGDLRRRFGVFPRQILEPIIDNADEYANDRLETNLASASKRIGELVGGGDDETAITVADQEAMAAIRQTKAQVITWMHARATAAMLTTSRGRRPAVRRPVVVSRRHHAPRRQRTRRTRVSSRGSPRRRADDPEPPLARHRARRKAVA